MAHLPRKFLDTLVENIGRANEQALSSYMFMPGATDCHVFIVADEETADKFKKYLSDNFKTSEKLRRGPVQDPEAN